MTWELLWTHICINFYAINSINGNKSVKININNSSFFSITAEYHITSNTTNVPIVSFNHVIPNICTYLNEILLREGLSFSQFQVMMKMVMPFPLFMYSCQIQSTKSWVNIITNNAIYPLKQTFVNLWFCLSIELCS